MVTASEIVTAARGWLGVPVRHQGDSKETGCDCGGLIRGVGSELGVFPHDFWTTPGAEAWKSYGREPVGTFLDAMDLVLDRADGLTVGGVVAIRFTGHARHCAIVGDHPFGGFTLIHALHQSVIEHRLDPRWQKRIVAFYRFRGVTYER